MTVLKGVSPKLVTVVTLAFFAVLGATVSFLFGGDKGSDAAKLILGFFTTVITGIIAFQVHDIKVEGAESKEKLQEIDHKVNSRLEQLIESTGALIARQEHLEDEIRRLNKDETKGNTPKSRINPEPAVTIDDAGVIKTKEDK